MAAKKRRGGIEKRKGNRLKVALAPGRTASCENRGVA
jgi:hypothetical protein